MATLTLIPSNDIATAIDSVSPCDSIVTKKSKRSIRFEEDPVSDIFIVNRICESLILTMFYQPEDFARFRYERNIEMMENQAGRRRFPPRCSMDLTKANATVPQAPRREVSHCTKIQRPKLQRTISPVPASARRSTSPMPAAWRMTIPRRSSALPESVF